MVAIAMTREMGTLGKDVAQSIADSLGRVIMERLNLNDASAARSEIENKAKRGLDQAGGAASSPVPREKHASKCFHQTSRPRQDPSQCKTSDKARHSLAGGAGFSKTGAALVRGPTFSTHPDMMTNGIW
jgi:hypothetical protein